jgi:hypothetical protein
MNRITGLVAGLAALTVITTAAEAAQGCGKGWYYNGQRCVPKGSAEHRQPYHRPTGSSAGLGEQDEAQSRAALAAARQTFGDHHRPSHGRRVSSADRRGMDHRPHHRHKGVSVDLGPNMRLHFHQGGISFHHGGTD